MNSYSSEESRLGMLTTENAPRRDDGPRIAFLHLLMFFTLWIWAAALSAILRDSVDRTFSVSPLDAMLGGTEWPHKLLAGELAALLIAFPCFFYTNSLIAKTLERNPDIGSSGVRRWLIYISLLYYCYSSNRRCDPVSLHAACRYVHACVFPQNPRRLIHYGRNIPLLPGFHGSPQHRGIYAFTR
jgi:Domain of unknown function (DUF5671)